jgi:hypothetical protein
MTAINGGLGQAAGHEDGHGPQDHGFAAGREALVVADGAAVLADPGEGPLDDHLRGSTSKACGLRRGTICRVIFMVAAQADSLPLEPAAVLVARAFAALSPDLPKRYRWPLMTKSKATATTAEPGPGGTYSCLAGVLGPSA